MVSTVTGPSSLLLAVRGEPEVRRRGPARTRTQGCRRPTLRAGLSEDDKRCVRALRRTAVSGCLRAAQSAATSKRLGLSLSPRSSHRSPHPRRCWKGRISTAPTNSPTPNLYLGMAVSNGAGDALASRVRNRLQSDRDDCCQDSRRHFPFVAPAATAAVTPALGTARRRAAVASSPITAADTPEAS